MHTSSCELRDGISKRIVSPSLATASAAVRASHASEAVGKMNITSGCLVASTSVYTSSSSELGAASSSTTSSTTTSTTCFFLPFFFFALSPAAAAVLPVADGGRLRGGDGDAFLGAASLFAFTLGLGCTERRGASAGWCEP